MNDLVRLNTKAKRIKDPFSYLENFASGKKILNVGAAGGVKGYLPNNKNVWLHHRLAIAAKDIVGIDIDVDGIEYAESHGVHILNANCENVDLGKLFDLIVISDVIEHMNAPVYAVENLMKHLTPDGCLCVTTPNATSGMTFARILAGKPPNVYWDHVAVYCPEHIQAICDRFGYVLSEVLFFDHVDRRSTVNIAKSYISLAVSAIYPRLSTSFMAVIRHAGN
ncbi:class I SAM-dependent methyltransferase [Thiomicrospira sp.]|uniref:class I SAM-dependent methyltransferase n=1 Tax=Thiomicrospira sp. TaxID=935 RepID=UPI002F937786